MSQSIDAVETVDSMEVLGASVMLGTYADGSTELGIWPMTPIAPETASDWDWLMEQAE